MSTGWNVYPVPILKAIIINLLGNEYWLERIGPREREQEEL